MAQCLSCQASIEASFGLITCANCGALFIVDLEGNLQNASSQSDSGSLPTSVPPEPSIEIQNSISFEMRKLDPENEKTVQFQDVINFANSETSQAPEGLYLYDLSIRGIDTREIREAAQDVFLDSRLGLDASLTLSSMSNGTLNIGKLNPVKASIIIQHLRDLPVTFEWRQRAIVE